LGLSQLVTESEQNAIFQVNGIATERTTNSFSINGYNINLKSVFNEGAAFVENKKAAEQAVTFAKASLNEAITTLNPSYNPSTDDLNAQITAIQDHLNDKLAEVITPFTYAQEALDTFSITEEGKAAAELYGKLSLSEADI